MPDCTIDKMHGNGPNAFQGVLSALNCLFSINRDIHSRGKLDEYLSRALNVPLTDGKLAPIDEQNYVLTLDFTLKMLNIHERYECGVPAIIEGETGVGKTALIEMLSKLWNHSWVAKWEIGKNRILDVIKRKLGGGYNLFMTV